uniref:Candidate secreted effector n=1 Tax=Meloidogyne incognita TaxID=6306 RepID=A0A914KMG6_MELIC
MVLMLLLEVLELFLLRIIWLLLLVQFYYQKKVFRRIRINLFFAIFSGAFSH